MAQRIRKLSRGREVFWVATLLIVVGLAVPGSSPASQVADKPPGGLVAYGLDAAGQSDAAKIRVFNLRDLRVPDVTRFGRLRSDHGPVWSPDGSRVAFVRAFRRADGKCVDAPSGGGCTDVRSQAVEVIAADGRGLRRLVAVPVAGHGFSPMGPFWSPDGTRVALDRWGDVERTRQDAGKPFKLRITVANFRRGTFVDIPALADARVGVMLDGLSWSPDGKRLLYQVFVPDKGSPGPVVSGVDKIYSIGVDGSDRRLIVASGFDEAWSPTGDLIAYVGCTAGPTCGIDVVNPDGTGKHEVTRIDVNNDRAMWWLPSGREVLFEHPLGSIGSDATRWTLKAADVVTGRVRVVVPRIRTEPSVLGFSRDGHWMSVITNDSFPMHGPGTYTVSVLSIATGRGTTFHVPPHGRGELGGLDVLLR